MVLPGVLLLIVFVLLPVAYYLDFVCATACSCCVLSVHLVLLCGFELLFVSLYVLVVVNCLFECYGFRFICDCLVVC